MDYKSDYERVMTLPETIRKDALLALCRKYPDRCAEAYYALAQMESANSKRFEYAFKASRIDPPSEGIVDRSVYDWRALDMVCITGYYEGKFQEAIYAHIRLKENINLIPEYYREQCLGNGNFSLNAVKERSSLSEFHQCLAKTPSATIGNTDIPNQYHIIWFKGNRTWMMVHYLAVLLVQRIQNPLVIYIYNDIEPVDNKWWDKTKLIDTVRIVTCPAPSFINEKSVPWVQHKADIARIYAIYEKGGVYIDSDLLLFKRIDDLLIGGKANMSYQNKFGIWNGFIASPPRNPFFQKWIEAYKTLYGSDQVDHWAGLSINTPFNLSTKYPEYISILPSITFLPFGWHDDNLYTNGCLDTWEQSRGMHLWETEAEKRGVLPMDTDWLDTHTESPFYRLFAPYLKQ
jgi:hypothetical protein